ncbi:uridine kinase [Haemophilus influenzae 22.4-21]|uniref:Uridine kinase n=1 Tax=Haemophilus influenzae 22.4-21 TaxID=375063 RepID=A4NYU0_HAEIF|nr:uridine kinase [Haemophilus influenzae 22.4-21]
MDRDLLIQHLKNLKNGSAVDVPVYSYVEHTRTNETTHFTPKTNRNFRRDFIAHRRKSTPISRYFCIRRHTT